MKSFSGKVKLAYSHSYEYNLEKFESIMELDNWIEKTEINRNFKSKGRLSSIQGNYEFTGTKNYEEARDLLIHGWEEKAKELTTKLKSKPIMNDTRSKMVYDTIGFQPSVPRYLQGVPQNMFNLKKVAIKKTKVINVVKFISYVCSTPTYEIEEESIKALRIIQLLENQGYKCNLYVHCMTYDNCQVSAWELKLKNATDRLNISKVAFPLVHPSFLRRINFAWGERSIITPLAYTNGYGRPINGNEEKIYVESLRELSEYKNTLFISSFMNISEEDYIKKELENILK